MKKLGRNAPPAGGDQDDNENLGSDQGQSETSASGESTISAQGLPPPPAGGVAPETPKSKRGSDDDQGDNLDETVTVKVVTEGCVSVNGKTFRKGDTLKMPRRELLRRNKFGRYMVEA